MKKKSRKKEVVEDVKTVPTLQLKLRDIEPMTEAQSEVWKAWSKKYHLVLDGSPGTGKTFCALYLALKEIFSGDKRQIVIVRSPCATEDVGFMPGSLAEKDAVLTSPYVSIINEMFNSSQAWNTLVSNNTIKFVTTAYIRGITLSNSFIIIDEMQNMNFHSLDSIITRVGQNSRVIFCGDYNQSDLKFDRDRSGLLKFLEITDQLKFFKKVTFTWKDCIRSGLVRDYLMTKDLFYQADLNLKRIQDEAAK
jgi:phosphate starvation-inducible protein PhoH